MIHICLLVLTLIYYLSQIFFDIYTNDLSTQSMFVYIILSGSFLIRNRRVHLFCPETLFIVTYFIILFFYELFIIPFGINAYIFDQWGDIISKKSLFVGMVAISSFLLGGEISSYINLNQEHKSKKEKFKVISTKVNLVSFNIINLIVLSIILYIIITGSYQIFLKYDKNKYVESVYIHSVLTMLSTLICAAGVFEFHKLKAKYLGSFFKSVIKIDRLYLINIVIISLFLLYSGNRNESLRILLPPIILFSVLIKHISNKEMLIMSIVGITIMTIIGLSRQTGLSEFNLANGYYDIFRDFGPACITQKGLIQYTDNHETIGLGQGFINFLSMVPFLSGLAQNIFNIDLTRSAVITTENFQSISNQDSGLGTSLVGDLYYSGGIFFVILFLILFGYLLGQLHNRIIRTKKIGLLSLIIYVWLFSDMIYYMRSEWWSLFRYIGFTFIIVWVSNKILQKKYEKKNIIRSA